MSKIGSLAVAVSLDVKNFIDDSLKAANASETLTKRIGSGIGTFAKYSGAATVAGAALMAGIYHATAEVIAQQDQMSRSLGYSSQALQSVAWTAKAYGVESEQLNGALGELNIKIGEAVREGGDAEKIFSRLHLRASELAKMDADARLAKIADQLKALKQNSVVTSDSLDKLGFTSEETWHLMSQGGDIFREGAKEAKAFGYALSEIDQSKVQAANREAAKLELAFEGIARQLVIGVAPYVAEINHLLTESAKESGGFRNEIDGALKTGIVMAGQFGNVLHGLHLIWDGMKVPVATLIGLVGTLAQAGAYTIGKFMDGVVEDINIVRAASNDLLGTQYKMLELPTDSEFFTKLDIAADEARKSVTRVYNELLATANEDWPSENVEKFLNGVASRRNEEAAKTTVAKPGKGGLPKTSEDDIKKAAEAQKNAATANDLVSNLSVGTKALQEELAKRQQISEIYRQNQLAADAPYYQKQLNDIRVTEQVKQAEILANYQKDFSDRAQHQAQDLERVAGNKSAIAAINAQYDMQEVFAEKIKQQELTGVIEEAQQARQELREAEKQLAISTALGLGQQLMQVTQGHSQRAFELSKKVALASAVMDGYQAATSAWKAGMSTGGPWAPMVAAAYTASSLLKTGALIQGIRSTSYNGGGGGGIAGAGVAGGVPTPDSVAGGGGGGPSGGDRVMTVRGINPGDLFTGSFMQKFAQEILQYQKDGGTVFFSS